MSSDRADARAEVALRAEIERLRRELEEARARIAELEARADVDPLLDILNRRGFERELKRSLAYVKRYGTPAALLYVDLDGFKAINDRYGHAAGDTLLKAVAEELTANVRASDVVARLGGDEFGVLMWNAGKPQALMRARDLEMQIDELPLSHGAARLSVGASVGVAMLSGDLDDAAALIDLADKAMYARKKERRG
ncbi:MAG TPA: GGDEF domain-containing protein [Pseudolabrys sp.]|nr:GGDEF domain-containing protein [Pseudolabrys sp.]